MENGVEALSLDELKKKIKAWEDAKRDERDEARLHRKYYHSKQWTDEELAVLKLRKQPPTVANRVQRKIDFLVGTEQRLRRDPKAYPRNKGDQESADISTAGLRYVADNNDWPTLASDAAHKGMVSGVGAVFVGAEERGGKVEVALKDVAEDEFIYDPLSTKADFSDAGWMGVQKWMLMDVAKEQWPGKADAIENLASESTGAADEMGEDKEQLWVDGTKRRLRVVDIYYKLRGKWHFAVFSGDLMLEEGESEYLDEHGVPENPYIAWACYIDEEGNHYGPIRAMKGPQDEINQRRSKALHWLNNRQLQMREGAVDDADKARAELAKPDGILEHQGEWGRDIGPIDSTVEIQGNVELLADAKSEIENLGPNPGLIGRGVEKQSGRAILAQQNSGMTELSPVFERIKGWKIRVYRAMWNRIRQFWDGDRWIRVTEDDRSLKFIGINKPVIIPESEELMAGLREQLGGLSNIKPVAAGIGIANPIAEMDVDIILDEGPDTITIQEEILAEMVELAKSGAVQFPPEMFIEMTSMPNKDAVLARMKGDPEQQAAQQQMQQRLQAMEMKLKELEVAREAAEIDETVSKTKLNEARASAEASGEERDDIMAAAELTRPEPLPGQEPAQV